jgi:hypothetical protein
VFVLLNQCLFFIQVQGSVEEIATREFRLILLGCGGLHQTKQNYGNEQPHFLVFEILALFRSTIEIVV